MKKCLSTLLLYVFLSCSLFANRADAQDNPDRAYAHDQLAAVFASWCVTPGPRGAGPTDIEYYLDNIMRTGGWTAQTNGGGNNIGYWTDRIHSDLVTAHVPVCNAPPTPAPAPAPTPVPVPVPSPGPILPTIDYTPLLQQILESQQSLLSAQQDLLASTKDIAVVVKDTNTHVVNIDRTLGQKLLDLSAFVGKYIAPAAVAWLAGAGKL